MRSDTPFVAPRSRLAPLHSGAALALALVLGCAASADPPVGRPGKPPPLPPADSSASPPPGAVQSVDGAQVTGRIEGLSVEVVSTYAYRDWMPRMGGPKGEDGGSPLHIAIGLMLTSTSSADIALERSGRLGATGTPLEPVRLDDLAGLVQWPLVLAPGETKRMQIGTRDGPYFPLGEALDLEIELTATTGGSLQISISDLPIGRTD